MTKLLITHINPHLDDIAAIWLFKKFHPEFKEAGIEFISGAKTDATWKGEPVDSDPEVIHFGIGKGKYDEHKGDIGECATSLLWNDIKSRNLAPKDEVELKAYEEMVEWNRLLDIAKFPDLPYGEFTVPSFIRPTSGKKEDCLKAQNLGEEILDRILKVLVKKNLLKREWGSRVEFDSFLGKGVGIEHEEATRGIVRDLGEGKYALYILRRPQSKSVEYFTDREDGDLTRIYIKLREIDSKAGWFFHHAKRMILCGAKTAPDSVPSKLTFKELIEVAKSV